ncbi:hypothetical protein Scep_030240 [Stephania cephalantha]|uniref:Uncharacterized protein n=1 Tax=Stephania cephalantha TaxID=152367 RepID=A0AAP0E6W5_9MAGN
MALLAREKEVKENRMVEEEDFILQRDFGVETSIEGHGIISELENIDVRHT